MPFDSHKLCQNANMRVIFSGERIKTGKIGRWLEKEAFPGSYQR